MQISERIICQEDKDQNALQREDQPGDFVQCKLSLSVKVDCWFCSCFTQLVLVLKDTRGKAQRVAADVEDIH